MRIWIGSLPGYGVELDARMVSEWAAAERVSLFDAMVASGVSVLEAVEAVHPEGGASVRVLAGLAAGEPGLEEARA